MNASNAAASPAASIDPREAAHFGTLAADWWNPRGSSAMLHRLNPPRLSHIRAQIDSHWGLDPAARRPLAGRTAIDIGCGAGLLAEPLARLGADVTGLDAAPENIAAARHHAGQAGLDIDYRADAAETLAAEGKRFDLVTCMEVIEHVADRTAFLAALAALIAPGGLAVLSTPNRTLASKVAMIWVGEGLKLIPRGTHEWDRFLTPDELGAALSAARLTARDIRGLSYSPARGFQLSDDVSLNYLLTALPART
jgi:2-polyprenyl-6-hydroxyphenyl methylase / 3-demethylubiquinone-9 3-methyltransferase